MATFGGTTQKCKACEKTVYLVDQLRVDSKVYHKACFRCQHCKGTLKLSNYSSFEGVLYCKPHFDQLFKMTGSLDKSFEGAPKMARERSTDQKLVRYTQAPKFQDCFLGLKRNVLLATKLFTPSKRLRLMAHHTTGLASSAAMAGA
ncbi:LIM domain-containing protein WLIM1-like isoform X2 [Ipomoea triloba]|uniref:LIM domain-containing protein WLIM1-like isoform X2 n=1 Tax=Ipomoea triloba TaxID=35885 RepID=UPI00125DEC97|nr:LIM domain-containing protein WLIM1-like isoform X2 [Ipomoea triloba]